MTDEFRRELYHSAKGTTWTKKDHKWIRKTKINGKTRYIYGTEYDAYKGEHTATKAQQRADGKRLPDYAGYWPYDRGEYRTRNAKKAALINQSLKKKTISSIISSSLKKSIKNLKRDTIEKAQHYVAKKKLDKIRKQAYIKKLNKEGRYLKVNDHLTATISNVELGPME